MSGEHITIARDTPPRFHFAVDGGVLFTICHDGRIERGPAFTTEEEASLRFWGILAAAYPKFFAEPAKTKADG